MNRACTRTGFRTAKHLYIVHLVKVKHVLRIKLINISLFWFKIYVFKTFICEKLQHLFVWNDCGYAYLIYRFGFPDLPLFQYWTVKSKQNQVAPLIFLLVEFFYQLRPSPLVTRLIIVINLFTFSSFNKKLLTCHTAFWQVDHYVIYLLRLQSLFDHSFIVTILITY